MNATEPVLETSLVQFPAGSWAASTIFFLTLLQSDRDLNEIWGPKGLSRVGFCNNGLV